MKKTLLILSLAISALMPTASEAASKRASVLDLKESITDDSIVYPESFETDARKLLESWYMKNYTDTDDRYRQAGNPSTSDDEMRRRLADLPTVIDLPYNQIVRSYIDRYVEKGRPMVAALLGLSTYYMPIFEQALEAEQLPLELKYLPVIESALDPNAVSRSGAAGLWQFMPAAAKGYELEVNSLVDERRDPYMSSKKAARMLHDLYDTYGDWSLAIAAYNCGPGNVNKALRRAGGDPKKHDFWSIYSYLSPETRGYVPMFIAANYVMNYHDKHNISAVLPTRPLVTDTIGVSSRIHFDQIAAVLNIPKEELRILNPQFRADIIPGSADRTYMLVLPAQQVQAYIMSEDEIRGYEASRYARRVDARPDEMAVSADEQPAVDSDDETLLASRSDEVEDIPAPETQAPRAPAPAMSGKARLVTHTVAAGETINDIAERYGVRVSDIRSWNSLRRNAVRKGQKLRIETTVAQTSATQQPAARPASSGSTKSQAAAAQPASSTKKAAPQKTTTQKASAQKTQKTQAAKPTDYTIKNGDNLISIAKRHGVTVEQLRATNGLKGDAIRAGKTLKIPAKTSSGSKASSSKSGSKKGAKSGTKKSSGSKKSRKR